MVWYVVSRACRWEKKLEKKTVLEKKNFQEKVKYSKSHAYFWLSFQYTTKNNMTLVVPADQLFAYLLFTARKKAKNSLIFSSQNRRRDERHRKAYSVYQYRMVRFSGAQPAVPRKRQTNRKAVCGPRVSGEASIVFYFIFDKC